MTIRVAIHAAIDAAVRAFVLCILGRVDLHGSSARHDAFCDLQFFPRGDSFGASSRLTPAERTINPRMTPSTTSLWPRQKREPCVARFVHRIHALRDLPDCL
jgi:hypothetical protein